MIFGRILTCYLVKFQFKQLISPAGSTEEIISVFAADMNNDKLNDIVIVLRDT
jgi:hypothetical protein